jgi:hypothetical protein
MKTYQEIFDIRKTATGGYTFSVAISDSAILVKSVAASDLEKLRNLIDEVLKEG